MLIAVPAMASDGSSESGDPISKVIISLAIILVASKLGGHFGRNEGAGAAVDNALERTLALDSDGHDDPIVDELKGNDCDGLGVGGATESYRQQKDQPRDDPHGS